MLSGCTAGAVAPAASRTPSPSPTPSSTYQAPPPTELAPLRGTTVPAGSLAHPSIAAKIDNHPDARPQVGLERTDIVFEELVEGGLTRYVALWQSDIPDLDRTGAVDPADGPGHPLAVRRHRLLLGRPAAVRRPDAAHAGLQRHPRPTRHRLDFYRTKDKRAPHNVIVKANEVARRSTRPCPRRRSSSPTPRMSRRRPRPRTAAPTAVVTYSFSGISKAAAGPGTRPPACSCVRRTVHADLDSAGQQLARHERRRAAGRRSTTALGSAQDPADRHGRGVGLARAAAPCTPPGRRHPRRPRSPRRRQRRRRAPRAGQHLGRARSAPRAASQFTAP